MKAFGAVVCAALVASGLGGAHASATVLVGPGNLAGWAVANYDGKSAAETASATQAGTNGAFVTGSAPLGAGSFHQVIGDSDTDEQMLRTTVADGTPLAQIAELSYWTYVHRPGAQASYLALQVDVNADGRWDRTLDDQLVFEPVYQDGSYAAFNGDAKAPQQNGGAGVVQDSWQHWDAKIGGWWSAKDNTSGPPLHTLAGYAQDHPGARLSADVPALRIAAGSGSPWRNFDGNADGLTFNGTTYDFEIVPSAPAISAPVNGGAVAARGVGVVGTSEPGAAITVKEGTKTLSSLFAASDGTWATGRLDFAEGTHTIAATATKNGVTSPASAPVTFAVDLTAPRAPVVNAPPADSWNPALVTIRGTAEPLSTIDLVEAGALLASTTTAADGSWTFTARPFGNGAHVVCAQATDRAGNRSASSASHRFFVDALPPTVEVDAPNDTSIHTLGSFTVSGTATDNVAVAAVHLDYYDLTGRLALSEDARACVCGGTAASWSDAPSFSLPGYYTVRVTAFDRVNNVSDPLGRSFVLLP
jgi:hypothetical protein